MQEGLDEKAGLAAAATGEEISHFLHDPSPDVIKALLANKGITEKDVIVIASRKDLPGSILEAIAKDRRWAESYPIRLALAKNPKTPLFAALSIARYLRLFDLAEIGSSHFLPLVYRRKIEAIIIEKIPTMPLGIKRSLARTASSGVLSVMLQDEDIEVVKICLSNPRLVEAHVFRLITRPNSSPEAVRMIAEHPKWSSRYSIRLALARNSHTPLSRAVIFFQDMKSSDLKELYADPSVPCTVKPYIHNELMSRGADYLEQDVDKEKIYFIGDEESTEEGLS